MAAVLQAMWQADGAFPSGSFAFSYGIEGLLAWRGNVDAASLSELIGDLLRQRWSTYDRVALLRSFRAGGDIGAIAAVDHDVESSTFGASLREGSRRNGSAFLASHARLGGTIAPRLRQAVRSGECLGHIVVMQGVVWRAMGLDEQLAQLTSGYCVASGAIAGGRAARGARRAGRPKGAGGGAAPDRRTGRKAGARECRVEKFSSVPGNRRGPP